MMKNGSVLLLVLIMSVFLVICIAGFLTFITREYRIIWRNAAMVEAFSLAEGAAQYGIYKLENEDIANTMEFDFTINGNAVSAVISLTETPNIYDITGNSTLSSRVGTVSQSIQLSAQKNPPAHVFDYVYFLNNWGWFYGRGITASGDVRSNGIFSFRQGPRVNGKIYAGDMIDVDSNGIKGKGGDEEHQFSDSERLTMPNLMDLTYYESQAISKNGTIKQDGAVLINGVHGDDIIENSNVVLVGTPSKPLEISGTVVVRGDVVIKGTINGQGTIYAGRNIYVVDDINYKNAPSSPRPANDNPSTTDGWVNANKDKDLVGFAATESIVLGDYTGSDWYAHYWLFNMGDEDVGQDGIPDTGDEGEGDGNFEPEYEDLDGDGVFDDAYNWNDVVTQDDIRNYDYVPAGVNNFSDISTNRMNKLEGIFYTNHAYAGRVGYGVHINGAIISKDEAIIYRNTITMNYDERVHSRYRKNPNWLIDLGLPIADKVEVLLWGKE